MAAATCPTRAQGGNQLRRPIQDFYRGLEEMTTRQKIAPCLWFDRNAEEAAEFYVSVFPDSQIDHVARCAIDWPGGAAGDAIMVSFTLGGQQYDALNGGPAEPFNNAVSMTFRCEDQAEVDRIWEALASDGGEPMACGWLQDKFGLRWQVVPDAMIEMMRDKDPEKNRRLMEAMMGMVKLDIASLRDAYEGRGPSSA